MIAAFGRSLAGKISLALMTLLFLVGAGYIALTVFTTELHLQDVTQTLNHSLADNIVRDQWLIRDGGINKPALKKTFTSLMAVNPSIEVYLIDTEGKLLFYSAPADLVKRDHVDLGPIRSFLTGDRQGSIRGDDPRDPDGRKIFSVAPILDSGNLAGFLYIVLGGQQFDSAVRMFQRSYVFQLAVGVTGAGLLLAVAVGFLTFTFLTRRLRRLAGQMASFRQQEFSRSPARSGWRPDRGGDEIDQLGLAFEKMSVLITNQIEQLERSDAGRRDMVAAISHDLRTPLTVMQGYLETLVLKGPILSDEEKSRYLGMSLERGRQLARLIDDLFELARLDAPNIKLMKEDFPLNDLVSDIVGKFQLEAEKKNLRLSMEIGNSAPVVTGDIGLIERVLDNLVDNAIKYSGECGTILLSVKTVGACVTASVADSGPGIPAQDLPRIFDPFYRSSSPDPGGNRGAGLGLAIATRIIQLHGGRLHASSVPGAGTTVSFSLPACSLSTTHAVQEDLIEQEKTAACP